jgi:hypothetical protein
MLIDLYGILLLSFAATSTTASSFAVVRRAAALRDAPSGTYAPTVGPCPPGLQVRRPSSAVRPRFLIFLISVRAN